MQRFTRLGAALALGLGLAVAPAATPPAVAHGGAIDVELGTDGAGGVSATLVWARDGHPVEESAVVVVRARSADGAEAGPVTLVSAPEGVGWYRSDPALLDEGHWTVTARVRKPVAATVKTELDVAAPPSPAPSGPDSAVPGPGTDAEDATTRDGAGGSSVEAEVSDPDTAPTSAGPPVRTGWVVGALVAAVVVAAVVVLRRRRP
ncbi:hypothetical protein [Myceligenerans indicum]|uniref:CopC domain-containing protein n=1 Tax=Myceligenerans indicum TaxID=2593663 RepID=A0ABS1LKC9_9MICO|nr:hypothetical protein [Myceligenerans indicum]MBL0886676.1 hypothetical protein [Myceligenerans indicum]